MAHISHLIEYIIFLNPRKGFIHQYRSVEITQQDVFLKDLCFFCPWPQYYSGMPFAKRYAYLTAINDDESPCRILIAPIELVAVGVRITGANWVLMTDPTPKLTSAIQAAGRPQRLPQKEKRIKVIQLFHD